MARPAQMRKQTSHLREPAAAAPSDRVPEAPLVAVVAAGDLPALEAEPASAGAESGSVLEARAGSALESVPEDAPAPQASEPGELPHAGGPSEKEEVLVAVDAPSSSSESGTEVLVEVDAPSSSSESGTEVLVAVDAPLGSSESETEVVAVDAPLGSSEKEVPLAPPVEPETGARTQSQESSINYDDEGLLEVELEDAQYRFDAGKQGTALCLSIRALGTYRWSSLGELKWDGRDLRSKSIERKLLGQLSLALREFSQAQAE